MGVADVPLSKAEELTVEAQKLHCKVYEFSFIFSSPLQRATRTTAILFPNRPAQVDQRLIERNLGDWAGCSEKDIRRRFPDALDDEGRFDPAFCPPGGETVNDLLLRAQSFLRDAGDLTRTSRRPVHIVAVTHNGVIRAMRCLVEKICKSTIFKEEEAHLEPRTFEIVEGAWQVHSG